MLVRARPPCLGMTDPSMIIGILTTIVYTFVIFIHHLFSFQSHRDLTR
jgi:hypothetical protein